MILTWYTLYVKDLISKRIKKAIEDKVFPGCVIGWFENGKYNLLPFGKFTYDENSKNVKEDSIYDVASVTKSIPTTMSLLTFIDSGKVALEDKISKYIPEFKNKDEVKIRHLLTYTLDLEIPKTSELLDKSAEEIMSIILKAKLKSPPGTKHLYTNVSATLMGYVVEKVSGKKLPEFARDYFFGPLEMNKTTFYPLNTFSKEEIVPTEIVDWRGGLVQGKVHDESTYILQNGGYHFGAAGLFSTAGDLLKFTEMILNNGFLNGKRFLSERIIGEMGKDQLSFSDVHVGLGWALNEPIRTGKYAPEIISKSGFTGCIVMINPKKHSSLVVIANRTYPKRPSEVETIRGVRRDVADIIFAKT